MLFRKGVEEEEMGFQMAPMIDCVFQLLVFFMCVSTVSNLEIGEQKILLPVADKSREKKTSQSEIMINVDIQGRAYLQGEFYEKDVLKNMLKAIKEEGGFAPKVIIRGDRDTEFDAVLDVLGTCADAEIWDVSFATYETEPSGAREDL